MYQERGVLLIGIRHLNVTGSIDILKFLPISNTLKRVTMSRSMKQ